MTIEIAVPTHNAAEWLNDFFNSVTSQDIGEWRIIARDDASKDSTVQILEAWQRRLGERMTILHDNAGNLGMIGNYTAVLTATTSDCVMLGDPDDVWLPGKIQASIGAMRYAEKSSPAKSPIIVCGDARVVDDKLQLVSPSYWQWSRHDPALLGVFHRMIVESPALTSTMMINRELLNVALPLNGHAPDWWLALVACGLGTIVTLPEPTVLYRRRSANDSASLSTSSVGTALRRLSDSRAKVSKLIDQISMHAAAFLNQFEYRVPAPDMAALEAAESLPSLNYLERRKAIIRHNLWFGSPIKNAGLLLLS